MKTEFEDLPLIKAFELITYFMRMKLLHEYEIHYSEEDSDFIRAAFIENAMQQFLEIHFKDFHNMSALDRAYRSISLNLPFSNYK